jgi:branched-chain amino acid transport system ATP-binding protein
MAVFPIQRPNTTLCGLWRQLDIWVCCPTEFRKSSAWRGAPATEPKLLLLDEPCTGHIREERENLARFILRTVHDIGPTIVWVEHDMQMVSDLADRVVVLNHGSKIAEGPPREVAESPDVIIAYLGQPLA